MRQGAWGWCTAMTQRDGMGMEVGRGVQDGEHMYICGRFMSMYGKNHYNIVISLQLNKLKINKIKMNTSKNKIKFKNN